MDINQKKELVADVKSKLDSCIASYYVDFKGCSCKSLENLRAELRQTSGSMSIVKNSIIKKAYGEGEVLESLESCLKGNTAIVWAEDDSVSVAKALKKFAKDEESFAIKAGIVAGNFLNEAEVNELAEMPSREESIAKLLALINTPATNLVRLIGTPATNLARLISAYKDKLESE